MSGSWWAALWDSRCHNLTEQFWFISKGVTLSQLLFIFKTHSKTWQCVITIHESSAYYNLRQRVITIYDSLVITTRHRKNSKQCGMVAIDSCFTLLFSCVITIYDRYCDLRRLLLQFTTGITVHDIITIHDRTVCVECYSGKKYSSGSINTVLNYLHILLRNNILLLI